MFKISATKTGCHVKVERSIPSRDTESLLFLEHIGSILSEIGLEIVNRAL